MQSVLSRPLQHVLRTRRLRCFSKVQVTHNTSIPDLTITPIAAKVRHEPATLTSFIANMLDDK